MSDDIARLRVPPHSVESEQSVLGGLLLDNAAWDRAADLLSEGDFYRHEHRLIYGAIAALVQAGKPADVVTVFERLQALGQANNAGGLAYLNSLAAGVSGSTHIRGYAELVRERALLRQVIAASDAAATAAFAPQGRSAQQVLAEAQSALLALGTSHASTSHRLGPLMLGVLDRVQELADRGEPPGVRTGFARLDRATAGLQRGDLVILAARPSQGKTALALNIAEHVALKEQMPVVIFSLEMGASQLAMRMAASVGRIDSQAMRTGRLDDEQWGRLAESADQISKAPAIIDEAPSLSIAEMRARARRYARELGAQMGLVVVDYIQLMPGADGSGENRATQLGEVSRGLKAMAKELQCPVLALSQLNRAVEARANKRPMMSDLRDSGALEQDADVIAFVYRDEYYDPHSAARGTAELIVAKQRNGPTCTVDLGFAAELTRFQNLPDDYVRPR